VGLTTYPENWEIKPLGALCDVVMGQSPSSSSYNQNGSGLPLIQGMADVIEGRTFVRNWTSEPKKIVQKDSILLSVRAPVGEIARASEDVCLGRGMCGILPFKGVSREYLAHLLTFYKSTWDAIQQGSTFTAVNKNDISKFEIVLPNDEEEQKIIAESLSDIDELINYLKHSIKKTIEIKNGFLHEIFHPLMRNEMISNHAFLASGGTPLTSIKSFYGGEIPWVSISDITNSGKYISQTQRTLTESGLSNSSAFVYPENTLLFAMYASIGKCAIPTVKVSSSQAILGITCKDSLNIKYLYHFLTYIQPELISMGQQGTQSNLNKIIVGSIKFPLLEIYEQEYIAEKLDDLDRSISTDEECLQKYEWLKQGMMNDLLTGKVRLV